MLSRQLKTENPKPKTLHPNATALTRGKAVKRGVSQKTCLSGIRSSPSGKKVGKLVAEPFAGCVRLAFARGFKSTGVCFTLY